MTYAIRITCKDGVLGKYLTLALSYYPPELGTIVEETDNYNSVVGKTYYLMKNKNIQHI